MNKPALTTLSLVLLAAPTLAQDFTPTRSVTAFTQIEDDYYNELVTITDVDEVENLVPGTLAVDTEAEVTLDGSVTYADAGQSSWIDPAGGDFDAEGFAAGGLYNQYNGEMRSESLFQADFVVQASGSMIFSYDLWFGNAFDGLTSHDRPGQSLAEIRIDDSLGNNVFLASSRFEDGDLSGFANVPLGPGQYRFVARAEISDATTFQTVVGSMTVANFYVEGAVIGGTPLVPSLPTMHVADLDASVGGEKRGQSPVLHVLIADEAGLPIAGALVTGSFTGGQAGTFAVMTNASGIATIRSDPKKRVRKSKVTCCIGDVSHGSFDYDPGQNVKTCESAP